MDWNTQQAAALVAVDKWLRDPSASQVFKIFGYAGTGKSTLAKHFAEGISGNVLFGTYTGKAASVLHSKGLPQAATLHSLAYRPKERGKSTLRALELQLMELLKELQQEGHDEEGVDANKKVQELRGRIAQEQKNATRPAFDLNTESDIISAKLLVVDEVSMVGRTMGEDLEGFKTRILVLGDPFQIPPVGDGGYWTEQQPDVMLTDVRRQALDSPVLRMATDVRNGRQLAVGRYGSSGVYEKGSIGAEAALQADQILVGRNRTRTATNRRVRSLLGRTSNLPQLGDKLVCLRNNRELGLWNGTTWTARGDAELVDNDRMLLLVSPEGEEEQQQLLCHTHHVQGRSEELPWYEKKEAEEFDYGEALTVHKGQGSQWNNVLLFDESSAFREHRARWLYTGITRAAELVSVAKM